MRRGIRMGCVRGVRTPRRMRDLHRTASIGVQRSALLHLQVSLSYCFYHSGRLSFFSFVLSFLPFLITIKIWKHPYDYECSYV